MGGKSSKSKASRASIPDMTAQVVDEFEGASDVMLSFHNSDKSAAIKLRDNLKKNGISVWMDETGKYRHNGRAIVNCQTFILLVSKDSSSDKICKDDLALAYISKKPIFPVAITSMKTLAETIDFGVKLTLSSLPMYDFSQKSEIPNELEKLTDVIKASLDGAERPKQRFEIEVVQSFDDEDLVIFPDRCYCDF